MRPQTTRDSAHFGDTAAAVRGAAAAMFADKRTQDIIRDLDRAREEMLKPYKEPPLIIPGTWAERFRELGFNVHKYESVVELSAADIHIEARSAPKWGGGVINPNK